MNKSQGVIPMGNEGRYDEVSLIDLVAFVKRNGFTLISGAILGGILGLIIAFSIAPQWEATALLRVGQLGSTGSTGSTGSAIEPSLQVVDRIKNKSFQNDVLKNLGLSTREDDGAANGFRGALKVKLEKSDLIALSIRGSSQSEAKNNLSAVIAEVKKIHSQMLRPSIKRLEQELAAIEQTLKKTNAESERLVKSLDGRTDTLSDKSFSQAALLSNILLVRESELNNARDRKQNLEEALSPERTFSTKEIGRVEVTEKPVYPKKSIFAILGTFIGLLLTLLWVLLKSRINDDR